MKKLQKQVKVVVDITGGVADASYKTAGVLLEFRDFDVEGIDGNRLCKGKECRGQSAHTHWYYLSDMKVGTGGKQ